MSITNVITRITVDMAGDVKRFAVKAKQYDRATRVIVVSLLWDEVPYVLDSADTVRCNVHKPDGTIAIIEGDNIAVSGNTVTITLPGTALTAAGRAWADIEIETQDESQQVSCQCFEIDIAKSPVDDDSIISTNEFSAMKLATKAANDAAAAATAEIAATAAAGTAASQAAAAAQAATDAANQAAAAATASIQIDTTLTDNTKAAPAGMVGQIKEDLLHIDGGLTATMKSNLATVLESIVTKNDVSTEISALIEELRAVWTITNNLTNVTTSNSVSEVSKGARYMATLTPISGYSISNVTVLMGGENITDTAYNDGVINIASVTGNLVITAIASESEEESQYTGYLTVGNPEIVDGVLTPADGAYVTSNCEIDTNGKPWELVTKIYNTSNEKFQDLFRSVDTNGNGVKTLIVEKANIIDKPFNYGMLVGNGSNWTVVPNTRLVQTNFTLGAWHKVAFGWTGSAYYIRRYTDDTTYVENTYNSTTAMPTFGKLAVGMKANALFAGQIDLKATKLYVDSALYWKAV